MLPLLLAALFQEKSEILDCFCFFKTIKFVSVHLICSAVFPNTQSLQHLTIIETNSRVNITPSVCMKLIMSRSLAKRVQRLAWFEYKLCPSTLSYYSTAVMSSSWGEFEKLFSTMLNNINHVLGVARVLSTGTSSPAFPQSIFFCFFSFSEIPLIVGEDL